MSGYVTVVLMCYLFNVKLRDKQKQMEKKYHDAFSEHLLPST